MSFDIVRQRIDGRLRAKAAAMLVSIEGGLDRLMQAWLLLAGLACAARIAFSPAQGPIAAGTIAPYALLILAPFASLVLALRWFADGEQLPQSRVRLARIGRWRDVGLEEAKEHHLYGASGIMVSLLTGMLLNVPVRALEYLGAMPALTGSVPEWLLTLNLLMTLDVVLLTSLYAVAFAAALRRVPFFPRLLAGVWLADLAMQLSVAEIVYRAPDLPKDVGIALNELLQDNVNKLLISVAIWLPYLLLSRRVNVTYRSRIAA